MERPSIDRPTVAALKSAEHEQDDAAARRAFLEALGGNDVDRIRSTTRTYLRRTSSPARTARFICGSVEKVSPTGLRPFRVALLSSFSIQMVHDPLVAHGYTEGLALSVYQPGYDQYQQEILDANSGLYRGEWDAIVLAVDGTRWAPEIYERFLVGGHKQEAQLVDSVVRRIGDLISRLRRGCKAPLLVHTFAYPSHPALGVLDATAAAGQRRLISRVNDGLVAVSSENGSVFLVDLQAIVQMVGQDNWYDARLDFMARSPIARSAFDALARYYLRYFRALSGNSRKCLILDLDNTLWGGVVGEEGPLGVALGSEYPGNAFIAFQRAVLGLRDRGVVLAIASKNNLQDVAAVFAENPAMQLKLDDFSAKEIHWERKSQSVARIAEALNLGMRHIVFADDNLVECIEVTEAHPGVTVIHLPAKPEQMVEALLRDGLFDSLQFSDEDTRRADLYRQREKAEESRAEAGSMEDFCRSLQMKLYLTGVTSTNVARLSQMTRKTTQFNATTRLYTEAELEDMQRSKKWRTLAMRVVDKFGDNGIVGLMLANREGDHYNIDTFLMSCRVINRGIETAMLHWLGVAARLEGLDALEGWILPTARNVPVRDLYERHGFSLVQTNDTGQRWRCTLSARPIVLSDWLEVTDSTSEE
jgi:FkbH-like protein